MEPMFKKNDFIANWLIGVFSLIVFLVVVMLGRFQLAVQLGFDIHIFAKANALINATTAILLIAALVAVKKRRFELHKKIMFSALILSVFFLLSYIAHHLLAGEAKFGDIDHDNFLTQDEKLLVGPTLRYVYYTILATHIFLAAIILPFILFTAYRALIAEFPAHTKLAKITWPLWLYVAITGPIVYLMISPYYH